MFDTQIKTSTFQMVLSLTFQEIQNLLSKLCHLMLKQILLLMKLKLSQ